MSFRDWIQFRETATATPATVIDREPEQKVAETGTVAGVADVAVAAHSYVGSDLWEHVGRFYDACKARSSQAPKAWAALCVAIFEFEDALEAGTDVTEIGGRD